MSLVKTLMTIRPDTTLYTFPPVVADQSMLELWAVSYQLWTQLVVNSLHSMLSRSVHENVTW